jgi:hypothetical protein
MDDTLRVNVHHISIPPMSTLGYGEGVDKQGRTVSFVGERRAMMVIGEALENGRDEDVWADVPLYCITDIAMPSPTVVEEPKN